MSEALPLPSPFPVMNVVVRNVDRYGNVELVPTTNVSQPSEIPYSVKIPIPNDRAYDLICSNIVGQSFFWEAEIGELMDYNIFLCPLGHNVTYDLYVKEIAQMLQHPIVLSRAYYMGTCRISPLCHLSDLHVQLQPAYVDTISYIIHLAFKALKHIIPASYPDTDAVYIYTDGHRNYRVKIVPEDSITKPTLCENLSELRIGEEMGTTASKRCSPVEEHENGRVGVPGDGDGIHSDNGGSRDTSSGNGGESEEDSDSEPRLWIAENSFDIETEQVMVSRIDYGGPPVTIRRVHLHDTCDVSQPLQFIPELAFPVIVRRVNGSEEDIDTQVEEYRNLQKILDIETAWGTEGEYPPKVEISYNEYPENPES